MQKKIQYTKQLIGSNKNKERLTMTELSIINQQIAYRNELISVYAHQIGQLKRQIDENKALIVALEEEVKALKEKYAKMIYLAYKNRNTYNSTAMMWFMGEDLHQAYLRSKYLSQLAEYRKLQVAFIKKTQADLIVEQASLEENKQRLDAVLESKDAERRSYEADKAKQRDLLLGLKEEEGRLKSQLDDQQDAKRRLAVEIKKAIEREIAAQSKSNPKASGSFGTTPEAKLQGKNFVANKGRLPWPVTQGEITGKFGKQPHPVIPGIYTKNNGVDISTKKSATVRCVFDGTVSSIFVIPGAGKAVMVSHGTYRTVYANLQDVYVDKGQKIQAKQELGTLLPASSGGISEAHFEIWHISAGSMTQLNPAYWLSR